MMAGRESLLMAGGGGAAGVGIAAALSAAALRKAARSVFVSSSVSSAVPSAGLGCTVRRATWAGWVRSITTRDRPGANRPYRNEAISPSFLRPASPARWKVTSGRSMMTRSGRSMTEARATTALDRTTLKVVLAASAVTSIAAAMEDPGSGAAWDGAAPLAPAKVARETAKAARRMKARKCIDVPIVQRPSYRIDRAWLTKPHSFPVQFATALH